MHKSYAPCDPILMFLWKSFNECPMQTFLDEQAHRKVEAILYTNSLTVMVGWPTSRESKKSQILITHRYTSRSSSKDKVATFTKHSKLVGIRWVSDNTNPLWLVMLLGEGSTPLALESRFTMGPTLETILGSTTPLYYVNNFWKFSFVCLYLLSSSQF